ncbi:hypothetical protein D910_07524, partial [Dendroctonus ponderosae]
MTTCPPASGVCAELHSCFRVKMELLESHKF